MIELLSHFCADKSDPRKYLHHPFSTGRHSYASNGNIIIRVPRCHSIPEGNDSKVAERLESLLVNLSACDEDYIKLGQVPEFDITECPHCDERGKSSVVVCPECSGNGHLVLSSAYNNYHVGCKTCGEQEEVIEAGGESDCGECGGSKKLKIDPHQRHEIGDLSVSLSVAHLLTELPDITMNKPNIAGGMLCLRFDGGDGVVISA